MINWVNYQTYAFDPSHQQSAIDGAARIYGGIRNIVIGLATNNADRRGTGNDSAVRHLISSNSGSKGESCCVQSADHAGCLEVWTLADLFCCAA